MKHPNSLSFMTNLLAGSAALLVLCSLIGLTANKLRSDCIDLSMNSSNSPRVHNYKRNELIYIHSSEIKENTSRYLFIDTRPFSQYKQRHVTRAIHYSMVDIRWVSNPVIFYGCNSDIKAAKKIALKMLPGLRQPVFIMNDGFDGWKKSELPTEN